MTGPVHGPAHSLPDLPKSVRLGDWSQRGISLYAKCICGADRIVPTHTLITKLGPEHIIHDEDLPRIANRIRCETCRLEGRGRGKVVLRLVRE